MKKIRRALNKIVSAGQKKLLRRKVTGLLNIPFIEIGKNGVFTHLDITKMAVSASLNKTSLEYICKEKDGPSADSVLLHLKDKLNIGYIQNCLFQSVQEMLRYTRYKAINYLIAADFTDEMYYGEHEGNPYVIGTKPKNGTYYAFRLFAFSIVMKGKRYFLWIDILSRGEDKFTIIDRAVQKLIELFPKKNFILLMDREFESVHIYTLLQEFAIKYITPLIKSKHFYEELRKIQDYPALISGYHLKNKFGEEILVDLVLIEHENSKGEKEIYGFVTNLDKSLYKDDAYYILDIYSRRWGIETAFRVEDLFRIETCTPSGIVRFFFFFIGVMLYNIWIYVRSISSDNFRVNDLIPLIKSIIKELSNIPAFWFSYPIRDVLIVETIENWQYGTRNRRSFLLFLYFPI